MVMRIPQLRAPSLIRELKITATSTLLLEAFGDFRRSNSEYCVVKSFLQLLSIGEIPNVPQAQLSEKGF